MPNRKSLGIRLFLAALLILGFVFYLIQPALAAWWLQRSLVAQAKEQGWTLRFRQVEADFLSGRASFKEALLQDDARGSNQAECGSVEVDFSPWQLVFHRELSPIEKVVAEKGRIVWVWSDRTRRKKAGPRVESRDIFPRELIGVGISADLESEGTKFVLENADFDFAPNAAGGISIPRLAVSHGRWRRSFINLEGVTASKDRGLYIGGVKLAENLVLERGGLDFNEMGKDQITADFQWSAFGGEGRADLDFDLHRSPFLFKAAASFWNLSVNQVGDFLGNRDLAEGTIHEGRVTFRGSPGDLVRATTTLRLNATDFRWHERRWNSLVASAILVNRRIEIPQFDLVQEKNQIQLKGHAELPRKWTQLPEDFQLQVVAQVDDLHSASLLILPGQKEIGGEAFFAGEVRNQQGRFSGNLKMRGGPLELGGVSIDRVRGDLDLRGSEMSARNLEFARGTDKASGWGTLNLAEPRRYSGELDVSAKDIASYHAILPRAISAHAVSGGVQLWWSGDGTSNAHSGAFKATLRDFLLSREPGAVPLDLVSHGSYSPAGIAFNHLTVQRPLIKLDTTLLVRQDSLELRDLRIAGSGGSSLTGNLTLPINVLAALNTPSAESLLRSTASANGQLFGNKIRLEELGDLAGQRLPYRGQVTFDLSLNGPLEALEGRLQLSGNDLVLANGAALAGIKASASLSEGPLFVHAEFNPGAARDQVTLDFGGTTQLSSESLLKGTWLDENAPISGQIVASRLNVSLLHPWFPAARAFKGDLAGAANFNGTRAKPDLTGRVSFLETTWQPEWLKHPLEKLRGDVLFSEGRLFWQALGGGYRRGGAFTASGTTGISPAEEVDLAVAGKHLDLTSAEGFDGIFDASVRLRGAEGARSVAGDVHFQQANWRNRALSLVVSRPETAGAFRVPLLPADWVLALQVTAASPVTFATKESFWQMQPDLKLTGTAAQPLFEGEAILSLGGKTRGGEIPVYFSKSRLEEGFVGGTSFITPLDQAIPAPKVAPAGWINPARLRLELRPVP